MSFVSPVPRVVPVLRVLLCAALLGSFLGGCDEKQKVTPPPPPGIEYIEQSSALNVLANFKTAYEERDYAGYERLFASEYIFVFNPLDLGDPDNPSPAQWSRADEMSSAENLLEKDDAVEAITLSWSVGDVQADDDSGWKIRVDEVNLSVNTRDEQGQLWIYQAKGSYQVFYFREEPTNPTPSGKKRWTITKWEDSPVGLLGRTAAGSFAPRVQETTWGQIKHLYYRG
jgi:hypothetical protein